MKTLTKTNLDAMAKLLPELDEDSQRCIVGGTGSCSGSTGSVPDAPTGFTFEQMNSMMDNGSWTGGYVDGYGYYAQEIVVTGSYCITGACPEDRIVKSWSIKLVLSDSDASTNFLPENGGNAYQEFMSGVGGCINDFITNTFGGGDPSKVDAMSGATTERTMKTMEAMKDIVMGQGGPLGDASDLVWGAVTDAAQDLIDQGKKYINDLDNSMGKGGNYSFWAWNMGF